MTVHCPNRNDHMPHRSCAGCGQPEYRADNGVWTHCKTGHCPVTAAELVRQYDTQCGPQARDPFDADVWMWAAANLLRTLGGN